MLSLLCGTAAASSPGGHRLCEKCCALFLEGQLRDRTAIPACPAGCQCSVGYALPHPTGALSESLAKTFPQDWARRVRQDAEHTDLIQHVRERAEAAESQMQQRCAQQAAGAAHAGIVLADLNAVAAEGGEGAQGGQGAEGGEGAQGGQGQRGGRGTKRQHCM
ncbi:hypothetical protein JKP88DRAFT_279042 [Tribonema minus]|uniref:Uncharacterized protein n=1 Tax=Tribonema minus TaxID=303371 RepID=A0A835Z2R0_9STRA|nr:hypothetical protein JKP88DRAFT_279042 [Tribonema minus]